MEVFAFLIIVILIYLYIKPLLIARERRHNNYAAICVLNIIFGWTLLGWAIALIWSLTDNTTDNTKDPEK